MIKPDLNIGIIGCGKMGRDLFELLVGYPFSISIICETEEQCGLIKSGFNKKQKRALKYGLIDQDTFDFRIKQTKFTTEYWPLQTSDLIIEAITENIELKRNLFKRIKAITPSNCIVASNSSSITPDILFSDILSEENCVGLHFFYPASLKDIIEVNRGEMTSERTISNVKSFLHMINKFHIILSQKHHFIINRMFLKMQAGCCQILQDGGASVFEIDGLIKSKLFPIGVFEFFDHVGNDVMLESVRNYVKYETDQEFYMPLLNILEQKVKRGELGVKTNSGFYKYPIPVKSKSIDTTKNLSLLKKITDWYLDGVFQSQMDASLSKREMNHIVREYMLCEKSPFDLAKEIGYTPK